MLPPVGHLWADGKGVLKMATKLIVPKGFRLIFRAWITDKDGNRVYAKDHGKRGFPLLVPVK
jgi:hypothetical protein